MSATLRELATLRHARRQLREHYLSDNPDNAANHWFGAVAKAGLTDSSAEDADDEVAAVVESALWSSRLLLVRERSPR